MLAAVGLAYAGIVYFFKDRVEDVLNRALDKISSLDKKTMVLIIVVLMIVLRIFYSLFFGFDASSDGDISIYYSIADSLANGVKPDGTISHLYGMAVHIALFKFLHIEPTIGLFIAICLTVIINLFTFSDLIGKEKAFFVALIYVLMPSTSLFTLCPTHEVFVFLYISLFIFGFNHLLKNGNLYWNILYSLICICSVILCTFVNPAGYILYVILGLALILANTDKIKKIFIVFIMVLSLIGSNVISGESSEMDKYRTTINTYYILIHGANPESLGEQIDSYPEILIDTYRNTHNLELSYENTLYSAGQVLKEHYLYLLKNPVTLLKIIVHKFYILYSGVHYPINMANAYGSVNGFMYYLMLAVNTLIYLFMLTVGLVYFKKKDDDIRVNNIRLVLLGNICVTMLCVVLNKYSIYVTLFIFFIAMYRTGLKESINE
ncbi:MAG: hypothetical protein Q4D13_00575 [Erysipelotrichaceae bacterium]|nr:hypothetical protein [Erysipelotrichaceae bacterium]